MGKSNVESVNNLKTVGEINPALKKLIADNLTNLIKKEKITQQDLAEMVGISKGAMNGYLNTKDSGKATQMPSVGMLVALKNHFGINIDDFLTKELSSEDYNRPEYKSEAELQLYQMYKKFIGIYTTYYLDTGSYKGRDDHTAGDSLHYGILSIMERKSSVSRSSYECLAIMGFSSKKEVDLVKREVASFDNTEDLMTHVNDKYSTKLYTGIFEIHENFAYITLRHANSDRALIILHCPATNKSSYAGGIGTINSVSKGREKMPTIQFFGISRKTIERSAEEIHQSLLLSYPTFKADKYAPELVKTFKSLYVDKGSDESDQSELQKLITVRANMERYIRESLENNLFRYAKISNRDDDDFYHWIVDTPEELIDPNLI